MAIWIPVVHDRRWTWLGIAYGCVLFVFAFGCAGMGHGSYLPFAIYGAPVSIIPVLGLFVAPVWWGTVGYMLTSRRRGTAAMMILHTSAVGLVLWMGSPMEPWDEQWEHFSRIERAMPMLLWSGIAVYVVGQVVAWVATVAVYRPQLTSSDRAGIAQRRGNQ